MTSSILHEILKTHKINWVVLVGAAWRRNTFIQHQQPNRRLAALSPNQRWATRRGMKLVCFFNVLAAPCRPYHTKQKLPALLEVPGVYD
jgi:hypothetical protein